MKLLDLLVQELPKRGGWPSWAAACVQDGKGVSPRYVKFVGKGFEISYNGRVWRANDESAWGEGGYDNQDCDFSSDQLATDHATRIVTREEYEAATRDFSKLTAPELLKVLQDATSALIDASAQRDEVVTPAQRIEQLRNARDAAVKAYDDAFVSGEAELRKLKLGDKILTRSELERHDNLTLTLASIEHTRAYDGEKYECWFVDDNDGDKYCIDITSTVRFARV